MKQPLLLWDIDGTLLQNPNGNKGSHLEEFLQAVSRASGKNNLNPPDKLDGSTDFAIIHSILENSGFSRKEADSIFVAALLELEKATTSTNLIAQTRNLVPGVKENLANLDGQYISTYATGNSPFRAQAKTGYFGIDKYLDPSIGGFGWWTASRTDFVARAVYLAKNKFTELEFTPVVIGDTPADITSAKNLGFLSVAVSAGVFTSQDLEKYNPDLIINNFSENIFVDFLTKI